MPKRNRLLRGFTIVELLTVIAIITLLAGILVPAIRSARVQAKAAASRGAIRAIGQGCEMFHNTFNRYPDSRSVHGNPFEGSNWPGNPPSVHLSGAQWLVLQLCGADLQGYVPPRKENDSNGDGLIDSADWLDWYSASPQRQYVREQPFVPADGNLAMSPGVYRKRMSFVGPAPPELSEGGSGGSSDWNNGRLPFFVDSFGYPILYYAADPHAKQPVTTSYAAGEIGVYDQTDNAVFTGSTGGHGYYPAALPGWDLGSGPLGGSTFFHGLAELGYEYEPSNPVYRPTPPRELTFMYAIYDRGLYESTKRPGSGGRVWPVHPDTFLLISPGADGRWGTSDDVRNY